MVAYKMSTISIAVAELGDGHAGEPAGNGHQAIVGL